MHLRIWRRVSSHLVADCKVFTVTQKLMEGENKSIDAYVIENPDWVNIIALTAEMQVVLIEQFRYGIEKVILELPGGMIDEGENAERAARRELLEETGFSAEKFILLGISNPNPAIQNNRIYHYLAINARKTSDTDFDENESISTKLVPIKETDYLIKSGKITHSLVVSAFHYFSLWQKDFS